MRTGAPTNLLHFLRWFKRNGNRPFSVLLGAGGELSGEFSELADTWSMDLSRWCPGARRRALLSAAGLGGLARRAELADVRGFASRFSPALVYANSIATARIVDAIDSQVPILTHVHELDFMFRVQKSSALCRLLAQTRQFIACSNAVKKYLISECGVPPDRVETVHESIPVEQVRVERPRDQILRELRIPNNALLISGSGTLNWIKGPDLFLQLARAICQARTDVYFVWVGGGLASEVAQFEHDVGRAGLRDRVRLTGLVSRPADYFGATDIFVLTSRQDSYALVCLEAAALGKPIICFADAGGMPEFVEEDCGFVVPYLDIAVMADRVTFLLDSPARRQTMGAAVQRKVSQRHDISVAAPRIADILERTIGGA
jgi:glycosyltransferase involved in cell wall biosynthesis